MITMTCLFFPPRIGDVALLRSEWREDQEEMSHIVHIPIVGGNPWWHCAADAPQCVQDAIRAAYIDATNEGAI